MSAQEGVEDAEEQVFDWGHGNTWQQQTRYNENTQNSMMQDSVTQQTKHQVRFQFQTLIQYM